MAAGVFLGGSGDGRMTVGASGKAGGGLANMLFSAFVPLCGGAGIAGEYLRRNSSGERIGSEAAMSKR
jgi:hypothetical protein